MGWSGLQADHSSTNKNQGINSDSKLTFTL